MPPSGQVNTSAPLSVVTATSPARSVTGGASPACSRHSPSSTTCAKERELAAELPMMLQVLEGEVVVHGAGGERPVDVTPCLADRGAVNSCAFL